MADSFFGIVRWYIDYSREVWIAAMKLQAIIPGRPVNIDKGGKLRKLCSS